MGLLTLGCPVDIFVNIFFFLGSEKESSVSNAHCTEVRFASFLSSGFDKIAVVNPPEMKLAFRTSVQCIVYEALRAQSKFVRRFNNGTLFFSTVTAMQATQHSTLTVASLKGG